MRTPTHKVLHGDCLEVLATIADCSVDAVVCDPPYGLSNTTPDKVTDTIVRWAQGDREYTPTGRGFMGQEWDAFVPPPAVWDEALRVLKPGGHLVAFAGSRTQDLMGLSIRLAGWEIRENLAWISGSGFPKSHDISKGIDKEANRRDLFEPIRTHIREWRDRNGMNNADLNAAVGSKTNGCGMARHWTSTEGGQHAIPSKDQWVHLKHILGWPDCELDELYKAVKDGAERPVVGVQKNAMSGWKMDGTTKFVDRNVTTAATSEAEKWSGWGTALKPSHEPIILARKPFPGTVASNVLEHGTGGLNIDATRIGTTDKLKPRQYQDMRGGNFNNDEMGRNPGAGAYQQHQAGRWPANAVLDSEAAPKLDEQCEGSSRFFKVVEPDPPFKYAAKAPKRERPSYTGEDGTVVQHPTVKPLSVIRWLTRLVCPPGGTVLDLFAGTGTTGEACELEGFNSILIENKPEYIPLIHQRLDRAKPPETPDSLF